MNLIRIGRSVCAWIFLIRSRYWSIKFFPCPWSNFLPTVCMIFVKHSRSSQRSAKFSLVPRFKSVFRHLCKIASDTRSSLPNSPINLILPMAFFRACTRASWGSISSSTVWVIVDCPSRIRFSNSYSHLASSNRRNVRIDASGGSKLGASWSKRRHNSASIDEKQTTWWNLVDSLSDWRPTSYLSAPWMARTVNTLPSIGDLISVRAYSLHKSLHLRHDDRMLFFSFNND